MDSKDFPPVQEIEVFDWFAAEMPRRELHLNLKGFWQDARRIKNNIGKVQKQGKSATKIMAQVDEALATLRGQIATCERDDNNDHSIEEQLRKLKDSETALSATRQELQTIGDDLCEQQLQLLEQYKEFTEKSTVCRKHIVLSSLEQTLLNIEKELAYDAVRAESPKLFVVLIEVLCGLAAVGCLIALMFTWQTDAYGYPLATVNEQYVHALQAWTIGLVAFPFGLQLVAMVVPRLGAMLSICAGSWQRFLLYGNLEIPKLPQYDPPFVAGNKQIQTKEKLEG